MSQRKTAIKDINGNYLCEGDIVAEGTVGDVIWDGAAVMRQRPLGKVEILTDEIMEIYPQEYVNIAHYKTGIVRLTGDAPEFFWNHANEEGDRDIYLDTYDGLYCFCRNHPLEIIKEK